MLIRLKIGLILLALSWSYSCLGQVNFNINLSIGIDSILDIGLGTIELSSNQFLACGNSFSSLSGYSAAYLVKIEANGDTIWKKQFDFSSVGGDGFNTVKELPDKSYLLVGSTYDSTIGNGDIFLAKIDTNGSLIWKKNFTNVNLEWAKSMVITPDNKVIILGTTTPNTSTYNNILLIKTDLNGNLIWSKTIGDSLEEVYSTIEIIKNNTEYLLGGRYGYYNSGNPYFDFGIVRTDTAGNVIWRNEYGTPNGNEPSASATYTLDGGFAMSGTYNNQAALMKLDSAGVQKWIKYFTLGTTPNDWIASVKQLPDSSFVMIGSGEYGATTAWSGFLIKADKNGDLIWKRAYEGEPTIPNYFYGFNTTSDGGFIITGQYNHIGQPYQNLWLVKTDSMGCDSVSCSFSTAVEEINKENQIDLVIYPNPNDGLFTILINNPSFSDVDNVEVYNTSGQMIFKKKMMCYESTINLTSFSKGIYFIKLFLSDNTYYKKVIVR